MKAQTKAIIKRTAIAWGLAPLLWSRLHGPRLAALGLVGCSLGGLTFFA